MYYSVIFSNTRLSVHNYYMTSQITSKEHLTVGCLKNWPEIVEKFCERDTIVLALAFSLAPPFVKHSQRLREM